MSNGILRRPIKPRTKVAAIKLGIIPIKVSKSAFYEELTSRIWFVDWSEISIKRLLKKKQLRSPY